MSWGWSHQSPIGEKPYTYSVILLPQVLTCPRHYGMYFFRTCLALRFQMWSWMLFIDFRNSNKMAAVYTVQTSSIRILNFLYFPNVTLKTWRAYTSASQIDCRPTPLESQMRAAKHQADMNCADFSQ